jgi:Mrp family chromosome partitioning ATPase
MRGDLLFARVQLAAPASHTYLIASPTPNVADRRIAEELASGAAAGGKAVRLLDLGADRSKPSRNGSKSYQEWTPDRSAIVAPDDLRRALAAYDGVTVVVGNGLDTDAGTTVAAAVVDATVLVLRQGRTRRSDVKRVRADVERNGGRIIGSILLR